MASDKLNEKKVAVSLGFLFGALHLVGVLLLVGTNGGWMGFVHNMHFLSMQYAMTGFDFVTLVLGTVIAGITGAVIGYVFALIWNNVK